MAPTTPTLRPTAPASAAFCACLALSTLPAALHAQTQVTITGRALALPGITGFGDVPLERAPLQASAYGRQALDDAGIGSLDGLTRLDAGLSDAYNAEGYWSFLSARGFVLDNRYNYRRDGLPINAETYLPLANKDSIEVLKGTSGIQAGTSAPGGLVNLVVKRPTTRLREAALEWRSDSSVAAHLDVAERFGHDGRFSLRINAEAAALRPPTAAADGSRRLLALAADWQLTPDSRIEAEFESSRRSQPSAPGFSLLGDEVPDPRSIDPRTNLNDQPWSLPVVLEGETASLRWQQQLSADWHWSLHGQTQRLRSDDRIAFPFGCSAADTYDRYCADGSFDLYDFRSEGERRRLDALNLQIDGRLRTGPIEHRLSLGLLGTRSRDRFRAQAFNYAGVGQIDGSVQTPAAPDAVSPSTNRDERSREWSLRDVARLGGGFEVWAGLRHTRIERESVLTDGSGPTRYEQRFTTPWLALAYTVGSGTVVYASRGSGVESEVVPDLPFYRNAGQVLPSLKSRQVEVGIKHDGAEWAWNLAAFDIRRPRAEDLCDDGAAPVCTRAVDGEARHRGLEASTTLRHGAWSLAGSAMWLDAERRGASDPSLNGQRPTNVPERTLKLQLGHDFAALPGLNLQLALVHEGDRTVLADGSSSIPGWTRWDLGARWRTHLGGQAQVWRLGVDNLTDRRAWREAPFQFSHVYLFPLPARAWRASVSSSF